MRSVRGWSPLDPYAQRDGGISPDNHLLICSGKLFSFSAPVRTRADGEELQTSTAMAAVEAGPSTTAIAADKEDQMEAQ